MEKVQIKTEVDLQHILAQLDVEQLEAYLREISTLIKRKKAADKQVLESRLLQQLNEDCVLSEEHWVLFSQLVKKREAATISESELTQLDKLVQEEEKLRLKRIQILGELSKIRGISMLKLTKDLGIHPPYRG